ncbi:Protein tyrosine kinase [Carpediemonas membranifera]|uniref:Protein tyrosine kinase n=1 Tax=Carpediemonas membranifera TaxID=201153 RepID=A0A8J6E0Z3_9EUKA|nr:Protein tyrosine kinase [Carpediemonas membranifera]|eukprot:KAG9389962.1 Protein tyrosine kinase [Carpediemonas membranifera]
MKRESDEAAIAIIQQASDINFNPNTPDNDGDYPLTYATLKGRVDVVRELLTMRNIKLEVMDSDGDTALIIAVLKNHTEITRMLINAGASIKAARKKGRITPLFLVARSGNSEIAGALLNHSSCKRSYVNATGNHGEADSVTAAFIAAAFGHADVLRMLSHAGADLNLSNAKGVSPLAAAATTGKVECVQFLIEAGARLNDKDGDGDTPLLSALVASKEDTARILVERGADINIARRNSSDPLFIAAQKGMVSVIEALLRRREVRIENTTSNGQTALFVACFKGHDVAAERLIRARANIEASDNDGDTCLMAACFCDNGRLIDLLLDSGANRNAHRPNGTHAVHIATQKGNIASLQALIRHGVSTDTQTTKGRTPLFMAAIEGNANVIRALISAGADVNRTDCDGETPINRAVLNGKVEAVAALAQATGVNLEIADKSGDTPILNASMKNNTEMARILIQAGANCSRVRANGCSALFVAAEHDTVDMVELLASTKPELIDLVDKKGRSPLFATALFNKVDSALVLLKHRADPNLTTVEKRTALIAAAVENHHRIVELFIKFGANLDLKDGDDDSALMACCINGHTESARLLINAGADTNTTRSGGESPTFFATIRDRHEILGLLINDPATDIDKPAVKQLTPLFWACATGKTTAAIALINAGCNVDFSGMGGCCMTTAAIDGFDQIIRRLLEAGANVDGVDQEGDTALICAAMKNQASTVRLLLEGGCNINARRRNGSTAAFIAAEKGETEILEILIGAGADTSIPNVIGMLPKHIAKTNNHPDCVRLIKNPNQCRRRLDVRVGSIRGQRLPPRQIAPRRREPLVRPDHPSFTPSPAALAPPSTSNPPSAPNMYSPVNQQPTPPQSHSQGHNSNNSMGSSFGGSSGSPSFNNMDFMLIKESDIHVGEKIGAGGNAVVFKGTYLTNTPCAVKKFSIAGMQEKQLETFFNEMAVHRMLTHPHVVQFLGYVRTETELWLISQLADCNLSDYVATGYHSMKEKVKLAMDVASGMEFIYSRNIVHRDLKGLNVLMVNGTAKIADFGTSKISNIVRTATVGGQMTLFWSAPERFRYQWVDEKSDVYSFAMVMYEILTGKAPWADDLIGDTESFVLGVINGKRPSIPGGVNSEYKKLMERCWAGEASARPSFGEISEILTRLEGRV